ncbi:TetR/AcrR family transcriptional regulator [Zavarzinia sp. CC-PAN008]|uniref:TetR/AcrR family transcriptional regulator n=1 Tax=Zavarzinia sp. CC-PAN008 TaxID=3243332 RepID=UPI003F747BD3
MEATARILVREGFDRASTNRIAEEAGVSIGSLYQYFPGKDALVAAVIDRHARQIRATVEEAMATIADMALDQAVRAMVALAIRAHRIDPRLHRVLAEQTPRTGRLDEVEVFDRELFVLFRRALEARRDAVRPLDLDLAAYVCVTTIEALAHNAVLHRPDMQSDAAAEALVEEATRMVVGYLRRP